VAHRSTYGPHLRSRTFTRDLCKRVSGGSAFEAAARVPRSATWGRTMSFTGSVGPVVRRGILASAAFVVAPLLLLAAACGSGLESAGPKAPESAAVSSSSKHSDAGTQYTYSFFDVPDAAKTYVAAINDEGAVTGYYIDGTGQHGFIRSPTGIVIKFDAPDALFTFASGINNFGEVVGYFETTEGNAYGFLREPGGEIETIDFKPFPGVAGTATTGINNLGEIVGGYGPSYNLEFILRNGRFFPSPKPPGVSNPPWVFPNGINDFGVTTGFFQDDAGGDHGYVLHGTRYTVVDFPGSSYTTLWTVNDLGQVLVEPDSGCGFIYDIAKQTFDPLPCVGIGSFAVALNNRGQFSGFVYDSIDPDNLWHGFIATPVRAGE
jgi:probable HAF family extracellular repeat protein